MFPVRLLGVLLLFIANSAFAQDLTGSWQFTTICNGAGNFAGTGYSTITGSAPNFLITPSTTDCGSGTAGGAVQLVTACSSAPPSVALTTAGGGTYTIASSTTTQTWAAPFTDPSCETMMTSIPVHSTVPTSEVLNGVHSPATGSAEVLTGTLSFIGMIDLLDVSMSSCGMIDPAGLVCTFEGRKNGVPTGTNVTVEPIEDVIITFDNVTGAGEVKVTLLSQSSGALPANFMLVDPQLFYNVTTTATHTGNIEICFPYPDSVAPFGTVDGTNISPPTNLTLIKTPPGGTTGLPLTQGPGTTVCAEVTGFSEFALGFTPSPVPSLSRLGAAMALVALGVPGFVLLRRRMARD